MTKQESEQPGALGRIDIHQKTTKVNVNWIKHACLVLALVTGTLTLQAQDKKAAALDYLRNQAELSGVAQDDLSDLRISNMVPGGKNSYDVVYVQQAHKGIDIHHALINVVVGNDGKATSHAGAFAGNLERGANATTPQMSVLDALGNAARQLDYDAPVGVEILEEPIGDNMTGVLSKGNISMDDIMFKLVYQNQGKQGLRLCWEFVIRDHTGQNWWQARIDAETGDLLDKNNWIRSCNLNHANGESHSSVCTSGLFKRPEQPMEGAQPATSLATECYNVFPIPVESPSHGTRSLEVTPWAPAVGSPFGWHDTDGVAGAEYTITRGNNVYATEDANADNNPGYAPDGGALLNFDFPVDFTQDPTTYQDALITNLFFWNNIMHDVLYNYGFDEASGNFQENNYGNGGLGSDYVNADAIDGSGVNNANFGTPPDGANPRMQMYIFNITTPNVTSDFDNGVIAHEYGHGVSNRLTGGPNNVSCLGNTEQMGEGWSDYLGAILTIEPGDAGTDVRGIGTYVIGQPTTGVGIRPFPYSTDMTVNPHTYADISSVSIPHGVGSVWCAMLWEMTWALIDRDGFDPDWYNGTGGNNLALQLVMDGMKLQACQPGFIDGRDAILQADQNLTGGANQCLIWAAFAKRGLGVFADQGSSNSVSDGTQDFNTPCFCSPDPGVEGCTDDAACNYDPAASCEDNSCTYGGCTDPSACNYDAAAGCDDGTCILTPVNATLALTTDCWGGEVSWTLVRDSDGVTVATNPSYGNLVTVNTSFCLDANTCYTFNIFDSYGDGMNGAAYGSCGVDGNYVCTYDSDGTTVFAMATANYGTGTSHSFCTPSTTISGCTDPAACNYNPAATSDDGSCILPDGCTDATACNYDATAACDDGSCEFTSCAGCTDANACNYDATATIDDGSCILPDGCTDATACNYDATAACDDGSCEFTSCAGCTDAAACNYDATATIDDGSCILPDGCTDATACNYDATAACDDGSCEFTSCAGCTDANACNYDATATIDDGSCILPDGCTDATACNYDATAACDDGSCEFTSCTCYADLNGDLDRNVTDLLILLAEFGCSGSECIADINEDGEVASGDILELLSVFGTSCD